MVISALGESRVKNKRTRLEGEIRREQVIDAARRLFRQKGYHGTSMEDIAKAVRLQKGSLYQHITNKEDLLFCIISMETERMVGVVEALSKLSLPATEKLRETVRQHTLSIAYHQDAVGITMEDSRHLGPKKRKQIRDLWKRYEANYAGILEEGIRSGEFCRVDLTVASFAFIGMCNSLYRWYSKSGRLAAEDIAEILANMVVRTLAVTPTDGGLEADPGGPA